MNKKDEKAERPKMGDFLKQMPVVATPVQEIRPIASKSVEEEQVKINGFFVPPSLAKRLKIYAATNDMKQREILIEALEAYLPK